MFYESEYNQYYEDRMFPSPELEAFAPDIIYVCTCIRNISNFPVLADSKEAVEQKLETVSVKFQDLCDFKNDMHTNVWGAQKVSAYVARELMERFSFVDHREDENYSAYVEAFDRYLRKMEEITLKP